MPESGLQTLFLPFRPLWLNVLCGQHYTSWNPPGRSSLHPETKSSRRVGRGEPQLAQPFLFPLPQNSRIWVSYNLPMDPSYSSSSTTSASTPALNTRSHARPSTNTPSSAAYEGRSSDSSSSSSRSSRRSMATEKRIHRYLTLYNLVSLLLWTAVLGRLVLLVPLVGVRGVYGGVGEWAKWTQTGMLLEVGHAAFGASFLHSLCYVIMTAFLALTPSTRFSHSPGSQDINPRMLADVRGRSMKSQALSAHPS